MKPAPPAKFEGGPFGNDELSAQGLLDCSSGTAAWTGARSVCILGGHTATPGTCEPDSEADDPCLLSGSVRCEAVVDWDEVEFCLCKQFDPHG